MFINSLRVPYKKLLLKTIKEIDKNKIDKYIIIIYNFNLFDIDLTIKDNYNYYFNFINIKKKIL